LALTHAPCSVKNAMTSPVGARNEERGEHADRLLQLPRA
jgi:hypothetical protein